MLSDWLLAIGIYYWAAREEQINVGDGFGDANFGSFEQWIAQSFTKARECVWSRKLMVSLT